MILLQSLYVLSPVQNCHRFTAVKLQSMYNYYSDLGNTEISVINIMYAMTSSSLSTYLVLLHIPIPLNRTSYIRDVRIYKDTCPWPKVSLISDVHFTLIYQQVFNCLHNPEQVGSDL